MHTVESPRIIREKGTVYAMLGIYCRDLHGTPSGLCPGCSSLLGYAVERLETCPFRAGKPVCSKCPVHCYQPDMREKIRVVMRHSGPKMVFRHPIMALFHSLDGLRRVPDRR